MSVIMEFLSLLGQAAQATQALHKQRGITKFGMSWKGSKVLIICLFVLLTWMRR